MKTLTTALVIALTTSVAVAQQEYHNDDWHFKVTLPDSWRQINPEQLVGKHSRYIYNTCLAESSFALSSDPLYTESTLAIFQRVSSDDATYAFMIIQAEPIQEEYTQDVFTPEHYAEGYIGSDLNRSEGFDRLKEIEMALAEKEPDAGFHRLSERIVLGYFSDIHAYEERLVCEGSAGRTFAYSLMRTLGSNRIITVLCSGRNIDIPRYAEELDTVRGSLYFDEGYAYGETTSAGLMREVWVWLIWPIVLSVVVFIVIYKWIMS
jgi:hypothetical protein